MPNRMLLIDGNNFAFRALYSMPRRLISPEGIPTGAVRGCATMLLADLRALDFTHGAFVFDHPSRTFRHDLYPAYKGKRNYDTEVREVMGIQKPWVAKMVELLGMKVLSVKGVEADDVIGTLSTKYSPKACCYIDSNDKDFGQLICQRVRYLREQKTLGISYIKEHYGLLPSQFIEYLMLMGDSVDNIPGVNKCGPKTATKWLQQYNTIKELVANSGDLTEKMEANLLAARKRFKLTRQLITIKNDVVLPVKFNDLKIKQPQLTELDQFCKELGMTKTFSQICDYATAKGYHHGFTKQKESSNRRSKGQKEAAAPSRKLFG